MMLYNISKKEVKKHFVYSFCVFLHHRYYG